ncbi:homocysteine S-methyltransferase family protein [bacterium]|nr:homocysteine S-methyltransferase family protein [bacterium]
MTFSSLLDSKAVVILDGAMGTELQAQDVDIGLPLWSANALLRAPHVVRNIHFHMLKAGADILTTNTFRTNPRTLEKAGFGERWEELNLRAVEMAFEARERYHPSRPVLVAAGLAPLEDCYSPDLVPSDDQLREEHARQASLLAMCGADMLLVETMMSVREAAAAAAACADTGREFAVSFVTREDGTLLSGESLADAVAAVEVHGPSALMINCVSALHIRKVHRMLHDATTLSTGCYANTGNPEPGEHVETTHDVDVDGFAASAGGCVEDGARIIGGCCGSGPEHVHALTRLFSPDTLQQQEEDEAAWLEARQSRYNRPPLPDAQNFT